MNDDRLLRAMRSDRSIDEICSAAGIMVKEFITARDGLLARSLPKRNSTFAGAVGSKVEILRDSSGVPHIYAASTKDLLFGLGVATAQDRLWQVDRLRRRALGRQAEVLGRTHLPSDIAHLTVGIDVIAGLEPSLMDGRTFGLISAFVAGLNRQVELFGSDLPVEFQLLSYAPTAFTVGDVVAIARGLWWSLNGRIDRLAAAEAARFFPNEPLREAYLTPEASENLIIPSNLSGAPPFWCGTDDATGSNNWAVAPGGANEGAPLLAADPHQPFWVPSSWYEYGLHGPEDHAAGCGHPGIPGLLWGSNGSVAWSLTNNAASTRDVYREIVDPDDPQRYWDGDVWRRMGERELHIPVRGETPHRLAVMSTVRGPVVNHLLPPIDEGGDPPLSLRWVGAEHLDDLRACVGIGRARDIEDFRSRVSDWSLPIFNFVFADTAGGIGYQMAGRLPVRGRVTPGYRSADRPEDRWSRTIPFASLPSASNPGRGYVASANQRVSAPDKEEPIYGAFSQGHRGLRIDQAFSGARGIDSAWMIAVQNDVRSARAARLCPLILEHLGHVGHDGSLVAGALAGWDFVYTREAIAATVFESFMWHWQMEVLAVHIPERLIPLTLQQTGLSTALLEQPWMPYFALDTSTVIRSVAERVGAHLAKMLGPDPSGWTWGRVHLAHWKHPASTPSTADAFDVGPRAVDGGSHTIRNTGGELPPHEATSGVEYRMVVDLASPTSFLAAQNVGNSGVPGSPHYRDQFAPWLDGGYHVIHLAREQIESDCRDLTTVMPKP